LDPLNPAEKNKTLLLEWFYAKKKFQKMKLVLGIVGILMVFSYLSFLFSKKRASDAFLAYGSSAYHGNTANEGLV
jgi:multisubunit Na+/H+ antiporter MnhB subunit